MVVFDTGSDKETFGSLISHSQTIEDIAIYTSSHWARRLRVLSQASRSLAFGRVMEWPQQSTPGLLLDLSGRMNWCLAVLIG